MGETIYTRAYRVDDGGKAGSPIQFVASSELPARDGMVIAADGWQLDNFRRNPVVLWAHDWGGNRPPIGRAEVKVDPDKKVLRAAITFDAGDEFAASIERKYRQGFLNAVSVGFDILEMGERAAAAVPVVRKTELLEISAVPVPSDPLALAERQRRGMADMAALLGRLGDATDAAVGLRSRDAGRTFLEGLAAEPTPDPLAKVFRPLTLGQRRELDEQQRIVDLRSGW